MYAVLDIESTGGKYNEEGITEIAIYKFDGKEIVDQFGSLINPERKIQPFVIGLTGINNDMLRYAPKFYEVAKRIIEITENCTIVAHNSKFDYRLLRLEFNRLGYDYKRKTLCTVELSRKLIPNMPSYSLGKLTKNLGIPIPNRHRAFGDAQATVKLFKLLLNKDTDKAIIQSNIQQTTNQKPLHKWAELVQHIPSETGVYYFQNAKGEVIYIGKSKNIQGRINQHLTGNSRKAERLKQEVYSIDYDLTGNEMIALLIENNEIKKIKPKYNKALKRSIFTHALYVSKDKEGYLHLNIAKNDGRRNSITVFTSLQQAKTRVEKMIAHYGLCMKLCGLHYTENACFNHSIKKCNGACIGEETPEEYNKKVKELMAHFSFEEKNMMIIGKGRQPAEKSAVLIENGVIKGFAFYELNHQLNSPDIIKNLLTPLEDNKDARRIIKSYLYSDKALKIITF